MYTSNQVGTTTDHRRGEHPRRETKNLPAPVVFLILTCPSRVFRLEHKSRSRLSGHPHICINYFFGFQIPHALPRVCCSPRFTLFRLPAPSPLTPSSHASWSTGPFTEQTSLILLSARYRNTRSLRRSRPQAVESQEPGSAGIPRLDRAYRTGLRSVSSSKRASRGVLAFVRGLLYSLPLCGFVYRPCVLSLPLPLSLRGYGLRITPL